MPQVKVPASFFRRERNTVYGDWRFAFWRELFQNSIDANSTTIRITVSKISIPSSFIRVTFEDDGEGMKRETLDKVYFRLGESTKNDGSTVGGFGRARILTCFAMDRYSIASDYWKAEGAGAEYEVETTEEWTQGVDLEIDVDDEDPDLLDRRLKEYVLFSNLPCTVIYNGEVMAMGMHPGERVRGLAVKPDDEPFATVFVADGPNAIRTYTASIRVLGTVSHMIACGVAKRITIEIDPSRSREILTASRDGLRPEFQKIITSFMASLEVDTTSALKKDSVKREVLAIDGTGLVRSYGTGRFKKEGTEFGTTPSFSDRVRVSGGVGGHRTISRVPAISRLYRIPSFLMSSSSDQPDGIRRAAERWSPEAWRWNTMANGKIIWQNGEHKFRTLMAWKIALEYAINAFIDTSGWGSVSWGVGFMFHDAGSEACHLGQDDNHYFLIRPVDDNGKDNISLRSRFDMKRLMAIAKHEVTHLAEAMHNETFSTLCTNIDMHFSEWDCLRAMHSVKG